MDNRYKTIKRASIIGVIGNSLISIFKLFAGFYTGSMAVISDGVDSATDIITSLITLVTAKIASRPPDKGHPYGHGRAETVATKLLSFVITFAGLQLFIKTLGQIINREESAIPGVLAFIATVVSIVGKIALALHKRSVGKKVNSQMMIADAKNMQNDILISSIVLIGLFFTNILNLPIIDKIMALGISIFIIKVGFEIFLETSNELMDGIIDTDIYKKIFDAVEKVEGATNPHRTRVRKMNNLLLIDLDIEIDPDISVREGHDIATEVDKSLRREINNIYDVMIHMEPIGIHEPEEKYGLSTKDLES